MSFSDDFMGREPASAELIEAMRRHGRTIVFAEEGSEELRYLDYMEAEANVGGTDLEHIIVRKNPSKAALLEEFLHGTQWRLGIIERDGINMAEVAVKDFMLRHAEILGIMDEDVYILGQLRDYARMQMENGGSDEPKYDR